MHWWERERDVGKATQWKWHIVCCNTYCKAGCSWGGVVQMDSYGGYIHHLIMNHGMRLACMHFCLRIHRLHCQVSCIQEFNSGGFVKQLLLPAGVTSVCLIMDWLLCVFRWGQGVCVWIDSPGQSSVRTQWTTTKELISNQLLTCFCPAPFIWLECKAGYHSTCPIHTHTPPAAYACVWQMCVCFFVWIWIIARMYVVTQWCFEVRKYPVW